EQLPVRRALDTIETADTRDLIGAHRAVSAFELIAKRNLKRRGFAFILPGERTSGEFAAVPRIASFEHDRPGDGDEPAGVIPWGRFGAVFIFGCVQRGYLCFGVFAGFVTTFEFVVLVF